jgi:adenosylcobyric acid synthase
VEDEDSLSEKLDVSAPKGLVDIAVIRVPRISNFTDLDAFSMIPGVSVRYVKRTSELGDPDMVVIPGSKNTIGDLLWMRQNGLEAAVKKLAEKGRTIFGICGGYQMLGETISDPEGVEAKGKILGMGLLPTDTVFESAKTRTRVVGRFLSEDAALCVQGYEIHMGKTTLRSGAQPLLEITAQPGGEKKADGAVSGNVAGTYVHGFFDGDGIALETARFLGRKKGVDIAAAEDMSYAQYKEKQYDLLADALEGSLDMDRIYEIMEAGIDEE